MKKTLFIFSAISLLILQSCYNTYQLATDDYDALHPSKTKPENILVYSSEITDRPYAILGIVLGTCESNKKPAKAVDRAKEAAAALGADAIINLTLNNEMGQWAATVQAKGTAIKFK